MRDFTMHTHALHKHTCSFSVPPYLSTIVSMYNNFHVELWPWVYVCVWVCVIVCICISAVCFIMTLHRVWKFIGGDFLGGLTRTNLPFSICWLFVVFTLTIFTLFDSVWNYPPAENCKKTERIEKQFQKRFLIQMFPFFSLLF